MHFQNMITSHKSSMTRWLSPSAAYGYDYAAFSFRPIEGSDVDCQDKNILNRFIQKKKKKSHEIFSFSDFYAKQHSSEELI